MKIAIDVSQVVYGTGVSQYTLNLVRYLKKIDTENEYLLFAGTLRRRGDVLKVFPGIRVFPIPPTLSDILWNKFKVLPIEKLVGDIDILHSSDWAQPPSKAFKVTTVHDLIPLRFPKMIHKKIVDAHVRRLERVREEVDRVIVPSRSTMADLISFGIKEERIRVIPEAPMMLPRASKKQIDAVKSKYQISGEYMVAFASAPYKNTENIIRAYDLARSGKNIKLILIGRQSVGKIGSNRNIRATGFLTDNDLSAVLSGSKGLIFASLYEGFGQPILEGFYLGIPVVTSNISSMPEVAGDAAALVDPTDVNSIAEGIERILRGPKSFIDKGRKRIKEFSWDKTAKMTLEVYKEAN